MSTTLRNLAASLAALAIASMTPAGAANAPGAGFTSAVRPIAHTSRAQQPAAAHGMPLTALGLALLHGATGPRDGLAAHNAQHGPPCVDFTPFFAYYSGPPAGIWLWSNACPPVPVRCVYECFPIIPQPWTIGSAKCTACVPLIASFSNASTNAVDLLSKKWMTLGQLGDVSQTPIGLAEDATGNIYVGQLQTAQVLVYAPGASYPTTVSDGNLMSLYYVAVDKIANVFVDGFNLQGGFEVDEMPAGSGKFKALPIGGKYPGGLTFDKKQNLYVDDQGDGTSGTISIYPPPYQNAKTSFSYSGDDAEISIDPTNTQLLAANNFLQGSVVYNGPVVYSIPSGTVLATGTASPGYSYAASFSKTSKL